ncbi:hypothetical protein EPA93_32825 [Ktedonosporobacter rubrisoli]|uniref:Uncharacterized protein n=1 Tax=Ktedonosporobacter rubrisoli TaxID=2509675 RepID=A0A4P6JYE4_KTERU|nr:hypothetical protein [Ktedonosporobacter rubrisoli]QBD80502.1 hypothetical protein EPA93_32825 [Ktedonosporobacter rubrisoli]
MRKPDDPFLHEQIDEQIEALAHLGKSSPLPQARLVSDLHHVYGKEHEMAERVWERLNRQIMPNSWGYEHSKDQAPPQFVKEAQPMKTKRRQLPITKKTRHVLETVVAVLIVVALVGSMALLLHLRQTSQSSQGGKGAPSFATQASHATTTAATTALPLSAPPTSVVLRLSAPGIPSTTRSEITIPSGTKVTLTVIPNHSLLPFQTYTMGIYATDPFGFSELQYCTYPHTSTCTYLIAPSSEENTDYTKGKHTFRAFLGDIGGRILESSSGITITWSS